MLGTALQIVAAAAVVVLLFVAVFMVYNAEAIKAIGARTSPRQRVDIFRGVKDLRHNKNETYNTTDPTNATFKDLALSINQSGGAEFAYSFWLYKPAKLGSTEYKQPAADRPADALDIHDVVLLLRGSMRKQRFKNVCGEMPSTANNVLLKCPLIKLQASEDGEMDVLAVELNTQENPDGVHEASRDLCNRHERSTWTKMNGHKLAIAGLAGNNFTQKWFMVTLVVRDTNPADRLPLRNKLQVAIYINGVLELERYVDNKIGQITTASASTLRQNFGPLHVAPLSLTGANDSVAGAGALLMADLTYFNYAPPAQEVAALFAGGFHKAVAPSISDNSAARDDLTASFASVSLTDGQVQLNSF
jgi:hypothetical protein